MRNKLRAFLSLWFAALFLCAAASADGKVIVSLGDSYSSGEGTEPFYGQEEPMSVRCQNPDWLAHRSEKAWPGLLTLPGMDGPMKDHRGENWFFVAASGALSRHLFLLTDEEIQRGETAQQKKKYDREGVSGTGLIPPQLEIFDELDAKGLKADYVTLTIGGNDVGFQNIAKYTVMNLLEQYPGETVEEITASVFYSFYSDDARKNIRRAYFDIAARAGDQARILVAGYPRILDPGADPESTLISAASVQIINAMSDLFNQELQSLVEECRGEGLNICFIPVAQAFEGHGAYAEDPWINPVMLFAQPQDLRELMLGSIYSLHLNEKGALAYAACVQEAIDRLEAGEAD